MPKKRANLPSLLACSGAASYSSTSGTTCLTSCGKHSQFFVFYKITLGSAKITQCSTCNKIFTVDAQVGAARVKNPRCKAF
jgi:hypothetical protein